MVAEYRHISKNLVSPFGPELFLDGMFLSTCRISTSKMSLSKTEMHQGNSFVVL